MANDIWSEADAERPPRIGVRHIHPVIFQWKLPGRDTHHWSLIADITLESVLRCQPPRILFSDVTDYHTQVDILLTTWFPRIQHGFTRFEDLAASTQFEDLQALQQS